jgi:hypothetical protein
MSQTAALTRNGPLSWAGPIVVGILAWVAVVSRLDPGGDHPQSGSGPGVTVDEGFNVGQGAELADRLLAGDLAGFRRVDARLPDHPPLGRILIGLGHETAFLLWPPLDRTVPYSVACARTASAGAFAVLVVLVGLCAGRWYGAAGGIGAALAVVLMPRTFGHAHLAALETFVNLTISATVLYLASFWPTPRTAGVPEQDLAADVPSGQRRRELRVAVIGGMLFGLALLTKVQAILLPVPVALWVLAQDRRRGFLWVLLWGIVGTLLFMGGWPHLWEAPVANLLKYLGRTTDRAVLQVWYFRQVFADRELPWHFPWILFLTTVPVGLHLLGVAGCCLKSPALPRLRGEWLVLGCALFPLVVFSIPGIAVYDGERLFSFTYPLWGVLIGRGVALLWTKCRQRFAVPAAIGVCGVVLASQAWGVWNLSPVWLSYYNGVIGGLPGAELCGLEVSYWGDGVTRDLLEETARIVPAGSTVAAAPALHPAQWTEVELQAPSLRSRGIRLAIWGTPEARDATYALLFVRPPYLPREFQPPWDEHQIVAATRRSGVVVAALVRLTPRPKS